VEKETLELRLAERWLMDRECAVCGEGGWGIGEYLQLHLTDHPDRVHDFLPVTCNTCGNTLFFHAGFLRDMA
jgi:hypothetical protein